MHGPFRRVNPTTPGEYFEMLPRRQGRGRHLGAVIGVRSLSGGCWREGPAPNSIEAHEARLVERADDWSAASFWHEPVPSAPLPPMPDAAARTADLT